MKKLLLLILSFFGIGIIGVQGANLLAERIAAYPLWLDPETSKDHVLCMPISFSGVGGSFVETGVYDISGFAKSPRIFLGAPLCSECWPKGFVGLLSVEAYINNGPFWVGVRNIGGGFAYHTHYVGLNDYNFLRNHSVQRREHLVGITQSPDIVGGVTYGGSWGCWDTTFGVTPMMISKNGGTAATLHGRFFVESFAYSSPIDDGILRFRFFAGVNSSITAASYSQEWHVRVRPGADIRALFGVQARVESFYAGVAYGGLVRGATKHTIRNDEGYQRRHGEYRRVLSALSYPDNAATPLRFDAGVKTGVFTGYFGGRWHNYTLGFAIERMFATEQTSARLALGYTF